MKNKLKIVLYAPSIHTGGGTERVLVNLANELDSRSFNVIIAVNLIGDRQLYSLNGGVVLKQFWLNRAKKKHPKSIILKLVNRLFGSWLLDIFLKNIIKDDDALIIGFSTGVILKCFNTSFADRVIAFEHWPYWINSKNPLQDINIKSIYPQLRLIIVLTEHEKKVYESLGCENVLVIPNAYSFLPDVPAKLENKKVLSIGHFNEQKRRDLLVGAWKYVHMEHSDWELVIVGDGHQKEETERQIAELGLTSTISIIDPTPEIHRYYMDCSIFALSSEFESFSLVLQEAKTFGIPCVAFDVVAGPREVLQNQIDGYLATFPDTKEFATKINLLIENEKLRRDFGKIARRDSIERYSPKIIYKLWEDLLLEQRAQ